MIGQLQIYTAVILKNVWFVQSKEDRIWVMKYKSLGLF